MSINPIGTQQDLIKLRNLAEQQRNQRAEKFKSKILKQTHDIQLAENLSPIAERPQEVIESTKKIGEVSKESNSENQTAQLGIKSTQSPPGVLYDNH